APRAWIRRGRWRPRAARASRPPCSPWDCISSAAGRSRCTTAPGRNGQVIPTRRWNRSGSLTGETIVADYTLQSFVKDLDAIPNAETDPAVITPKAAPPLRGLCRNSQAIPAPYRTAPAGQRGRYMLHRAPRFNVTSVIWRPGDEAGSHDHETWGLVGVVENEIQETRYTSAGPRDMGGTVQSRCARCCATSQGPCPSSS